MISKKYDPTLFELSNAHQGQSDTIKTESLNFWQDAWRRLRQNKAALISMYAIVILVICSFLAPLVGPKHSNGEAVKYNQTPVLIDPDTGLQIEKSNLSYLPPRVPGLENLGIFDGTSMKTMAIFDLFVGSSLPEEVSALNTPLTKKEFVEALGIKYHPNDYTIVSWSGKGEDMMITIQLRGSSSTEEVPASELVSTYSPYANLETFQLKSTETDNQGVQMIKVKVNAYILKGVDHLYFYFGTDELGFDVWTRLWTGVQVSLLIGLLSLVIDFVIGILYGSIAGFYGGTAIDNVMMRITEIIGSVPTTVILIIFITVKEAFIQGIESLFHIQLSNVAGSFIILIVAMSLTGWISVARVVRAQYLKLKDQEFVMAATTLGASSRRIIFKHLFPNIIGQLVVMATFSIPSAIATEAMLSFIGLGLPIPMSSLGVLLSDGTSKMTAYAYLMMVPSFFMVYLMLAINLFANGLRDALDPRLRGK
ncbi:MAG: ABC transporter permease [Turicibacter sp.]|nr:ABC transporter permease [Turicibacter sp.]